MIESCCRITTNGAIKHLNASKVSRSKIWTNWWASLSNSLKIANPQNKPLTLPTKSRIQSFWRSYSCSSPYLSKSTRERSISPFLMSSRKNRSKSSTRERFPSNSWPSTTPCYSLFTTPKMPPLQKSLLNSSKPCTVQGRTLRRKSNSFYNKISTF